MVSLMQWTWTWASSGRWWGTGSPSVLQSMGLQRVGHNWATEHNNNKGVQLPCVSAITYLNIHLPLSYSPPPKWSVLLYSLRSKERSCLLSCFTTDVISPTPYTIRYVLPDISRDHCGPWEFTSSYQMGFPERSLSSMLLWQASLLQNSPVFIWSSSELCVHNCWQARGDWRWGMSCILSSPLTREIFKYSRSRSEFLPLVG